MSKKTCKCPLTRAAAQAKAGISCLFADLEEIEDEPSFSCDALRIGCLIGAVIWIVGIGAVWGVVHFARKWGLLW